jgi:8-oxo-dGTP diphosphatase
MKAHQGYVSSVTVDIALFTIKDGALHVLLIERTKPPYAGSHALPGGFLLSGETTKEAANRILKDKAGVKDIYIEQLYTFDGVHRDPRGRILSVTFYALMSEQYIHISEGKETESPQWCAVDKLPKLAFDHKDIVIYAQKRIRAKLEYTNAAYALLPRTFALGQLQEAYEAIFQKKIDKRNFIKKFLSLKLIRPTKKILSGLRQRPARLYEFIDRKPTELKKFF